ncbi:pentapeptide repeat-containing protein [Gordonia sp. DT219]|uniref:pentapeptide repeat-containing protein n=1 Tax=Gordonia sp. DT219 TaxID=3416658 RepID=UPI003CEE4532
MTEYQTDPAAVRRWPDDPAARAALEDFFRRAARQESIPILAGSDRDFRGADLRGLNLGGAWFSDADIRGVVLRDSRLNGACLSAADARGADLTNAQLRKADLSDCNAAQAVLRGAYLQRCDLDTAILREADLTGADCRNAFMPDVDLRGATLDAVLFDSGEGSTDLGGSRLSGATLHGATGRISGAIDVGDEAPDVLSGPQLQSWLTARGARIQVV